MPVLFPSTVHLLTSPVPFLLDVANTISVHTKPTFLTKMYIIRRGRPYLRYLLPLTTYLTVVLPYLLWVVLCPIGKLPFRLSTTLPGNLPVPALPHHACSRVSSPRVVFPTAFLLLYLSFLSTLPFFFNSAPLAIFSCSILRQLSFPFSSCSLAKGSWAFQVPSIRGQNCRDQSDLQSYFSPLSVEAPWAPCIQSKPAFGLR